MEKRTNSSRSWLLALLIALVPAVGYAGAFLFEAGYLHFFGLDYSFAKVTPSVFAFSIISISIITSVLWVGLGIISDMPVPKSYIDRKDGVRMIALAVTIFLISIVIWVASLGSLVLPIATMFLSVATLFLIGLAFIGVKYSRMQGKKFLKALSDYFETDLTNSTETLRYRIISVIVLVLLIVTICFSTGRYFASGTASFGTYTKNGKCMMIIRKYDDELISRRYEADGSINMKVAYIDKIKDSFYIRSTNKNEAMKCGANT